MLEAHIKKALCVIDTMYKKIRRRKNVGKNEKNGINILTFVNCASLNFYNVYIPALTEGYFPKKIKSTHFISDDANIKLSEAIKTFLVALLQKTQLRHYWII